MCNQDGEVSRISFRVRETWELTQELFETEERFAELRRRKAEVMNSGDEDRLLTIDSLLDTLHDKLVRLRSEFKRLENP